MFNITSYLEKFKNLGQGERLVKEMICLVIGEVVHIDLTPAEVQVKNGEVLLKVSPAVKNVIYIKKEAILKKLREKTEQPIDDIR